MSGYNQNQLSPFGNQTDRNGGTTLPDIVGEQSLKSNRKIFSFCFFLKYFILKIHVNVYHNILEHHQFQIKKQMIMAFVYLVMKM